MRMMGDYHGHDDDEHVDADSDVDDEDDHENDANVDLADVHVREDDERNEWPAHDNGWQW